jgi:quinol-cytochrome oxidoreductase complex cytochrome b subunit
MALISTMTKTRRIAFAIWWKLCLIWLAGGAIAGFASYLLPVGQIRFWLATVVGTVFENTGGEDAAQAFFGTGAADLTFSVLASVASAIVLYVLVNWAIASHIGRNFGGFRLALERAE